MNIKLTGKYAMGRYALVDDEDFDWLNQWSWRWKEGYAVRTSKGKTISMHQMINQTPKGFETDHINRDKLDNRRSNLRTVTHSQNQRNKTVLRNNKVGIKGVHWHKSTKLWVAEIKINDDIVFYAFRYALGRKTYAVQTVVEYILQNWEALKPATRGLIQAEIEMAIDKGEAGMEMDVEQWKKLI